MKKALILAISSFALMSLLVSCGGDDNKPLSSSSENKEPVYYEVVFLNDDESFLFKDTVLEGNDAHYGGETPTKEEDDEFTYEFDGWDKDLTNITSNLTTKATYKYVAKEDWGPIHWF